MSTRKLLIAARNMDWQQVVSNGGPPCFHLEGDGGFCGRAQRWNGHADQPPNDIYHKYVSLEDLISQAAWLPKQQKPGGAS